MNARVSLSAQRRMYRSGVALLLTLLLLSLITIIAVAFLGTMTWEMAASRRNYENEKSRSLAMLGLNVAVGQLRTALGTWDSPYAPATVTNGPAFYWSVSPGILTRWSYSAAAPLTNYPLFSQGSTNLVNLNAVTGDGTYPIAGGTAPPKISVYWANVLKNPANSSASSANPIIGRYAFWVDDENAKININTADGTLKYTTNSLGLGTPSEVSLEVLQSGGSNIPRLEATNIVYQARTQGFNTPREILRVSGTASDLYANNVFNLTTTSRSPELNVFGEPKISLAPAIYSPTPSFLINSRLQTNGITGMPLTEIYPTPAQLSGFASKDPLWSFQPGSPNSRWRPLTLSQEWPQFFGDTYTANKYQGDREGFAISTLSLYLSSTNGYYKPVNWPVFPYPSTVLSSATAATSSGTLGFMGKYSLRQLDSLAVQAVDVAGKSITPELASQQASAGFSYTVPDAYYGFLSHQLVPGAGRTAKINEILMQESVFGSTAIPPNPTMTMQIFLETYLPAGFGGVDLLNINNGLPGASSAAANSYELGTSISSFYEGELNLYDSPNPGKGSGWPQQQFATNAAFIPRVASQPLGTTQPNGFWGDTLLQNDAGIDMIGNSQSYLDPDQIRAAAYHSGWTTNASGQYYGTGDAAIATQNIPMLRMGNLSGPSANNNSRATPWFPGQYRLVDNYACSTPYRMNPNATTVTFSGGLVVTGYVRTGASDPDPTPFDSATRGSFPLLNSGGTNGAYCDYYAPSGVGGGESLSYLAWTNTVAKVKMGNQAQTAYNMTELVRDRIVNGLIPVSMPAVAVPSSAAGVNYAWYHAEVADPLVNKFPGDWQTASGTGNAPPNSMGGSGSGLPAVASSGNVGDFSVYYNGQNSAATTSTYKDPDSFWMPTLDPKIPRSARMPNIGYFNYLRTGIIPDDETGPLQTQKGVPFRCLNFNSLTSTDAPQSGATTSYRSSGYLYPDWAFLDLFTTPSTLLPYNGPYGYYNTSGAWTAGSVLNGNPTNMYSYGTWGGSTPGRINPNGSVIYTTNASQPTPGITRPLPLQALLHNIAINQTIATGISAATATTNAPTFSGGSVVDDAGIAQAITTYIGTYGPLREPAEICNIPAVSANYPNDSTHYNPTRNDLVRQVVGNLTTQSNVFSVWVAGQSITKTKGNVDYGNYESTDLITATIRYHFIVERYLEVGADGTIGSPAGLGADNISGTYDDTSDTTYHPNNPRYLYRVNYAEEIRN
jgi:hypothetical protein